MLILTSFRRLGAADEVAAAAAKQGCFVTVLEMAERVIARCVPSMIGVRIASWHRAAGVLLRLGCAVRRVKPEAHCLRIVARVRQPRKHYKRFET
ncbi:FAD-dependent oxidoreductase [Bradyrhizobium canariense]|uniref:FAD-dependent oxidoreductase n=1 Tax=Bradyrhizobium canariense TaxID=255045 RepID=UPI0035E2497B